MGERRAAPPRPTLLVGNLADCVTAFERLQQRVLELSVQEQAKITHSAPGSCSTSAAAPWQDLVPRCRALRETLTSLQELSHLTRQVYECAAEVCLRARDYPEALKALQQLVHSIYPELAAQAAQQLHDAARHASTQLTPRTGSADLHQSCKCGPAALDAPGASEIALSSNKTTTWSPAPEVGAAHQQQLGGADVTVALQQPGFERWAEAAAALALYFASVRQDALDTMDTYSTLRQLPRHLLHSRDVRLALRMHVALAAGDYVLLFRLRAKAPPLLQRVLDAAAPRAQQHALMVIAVAYRALALPAVVRMLDGDSQSVLANLKALADRGHLAAQRALSTVQQENDQETADLVFRA